MDKFHLAEGYKPAKCCNPEPECEIRGYYSHDGIMVVHRKDCANLNKVDKERLIEINWKEFLTDPPETPDKDFDELDSTDFKILGHHEEYGCDYSLKTAKMLNIEKQTVFEKHNKLREMKLLTRVKPLIIQYRKGVVDNKWIKHRNHTYYEITDKGKLYLNHFIRNK